MFSFLISNNAEWLIGPFQKKIKLEGLRTYFFEPPTLEFFIFYFNPWNSRQNKPAPLEIPQNCVKSLGNSKAKPLRPLEIPRHFFLVTLGNSTCYFSDTAGNSISSLSLPLLSPCLFFSGIANYRQQFWHPVSSGGRLGSGILMSLLPHTHTLSEFAN